MRIMLALLTAAVLGQAPAEIMAHVHADLARLPAALRPRVRYLDLTTLDPKTRPAAVRTLAGHCNQLSRVAVLTAPVQVSPALLRLTLDDYGWDPLVWDRLGESDPYYTVRVVEDWPGGIYRHDGRHYPPGAFRVAKPYPAPWTGPQAAEVWTWTQSLAPVLRADWWHNQTAAQADRPAGYYDFLGIADEKGFQKLIGFDAAKAEAFRFELRAAIADSGVTLQPRAIARHDALGGGYWRSFDYKVAINEKNPLRVLGRDAQKAYDATEQFGALPNGFWATGLFDGAGKRQDFAPPDIASDGRSLSHDKRVHVNVSCTRCHVEGGLRPLDDWTRNLLAPPLALRTPDYQASLLLRQQYARALEPFLARDRATYEAAVKEATGMDAKAYAAAYAALWEGYEDARIGLPEAARSLGVDAEDLRVRLLAAAKGNALDPVLSVLLLEGPRRRTLGIRQWEEVYPAAQALLQREAK